jgi:hypothetical protein
MQPIAKILFRQWVACKHFSDEKPLTGKHPSLHHFPGSSFRGWLSTISVFSFRDSKPFPDKNLNPIY